jgi:MoaA/NifB/PqqE/SkfB family radical SAM enzyme
MYCYHDLRTLHLEITQRCNASCPQCARFMPDGSLKPALPLAELTLEDITVIVPPDLVRQLGFIYLCGNYGDPIVARDTLKVLEYFRHCHPKIRLRIHTNAGARDSNWWSRLATLVDCCVFGIDGLEDTNHLYRRGTRWKRIVENARAFIAAGGNAEWQFLVFKHNEHQVEFARRLSEELGFRRFFVKATSRFYQPEDAKEVSRDVVHKDGSRLYQLAPPSRPENRNLQVMQLEKRSPSAKEYQRYLEATGITCKAEKHRSVYLSAEGFVLPCCWMSSIYHHDRPREESEVGRLLALCAEGFATIDANRQSIEQIINSAFFQFVIPRHWETGPGRLRVCARSCGSCDVLGGQFKA